MVGSHLSLHRVGNVVQYPYHTPPYKQLGTSQTCHHNWHQGVKVSEESIENMHLSFRGYDMLSDSQKQCNTTVLSSAIPATTCLLPKPQCHSVTEASTVQTSQTRLKKQAELQCGIHTANQQLAVPKRHQWCGTKDFPGHARLSPPHCPAGANSTKQPRQGSRRLLSDNARRVLAPARLWARHAE